MNKDTNPQLTQVMSNIGINKTIILTYDDATRMVDFCLNDEKNVSKEFYDWYLKQSGEYFAKIGMLIIKGFILKDELVAVSFDFTNPDAVEFNIYLYKDQQIICNFFFYRQDNLTMKDISVDIKYFSFQILKNLTMYYPSDIKERLERITNKYLENEIKRKKSGQHKIKKDLLMQGLRNAAYREANLFNCRHLVYFTYALMYYVSKQEPEEITKEFQRQLEHETEGVKTKSIYKYTGYIDLRESRVYKPLIKKDPNEPIREYQRHIQKWTVRGHYRKVKDGFIWIDPHVKGEGELEKRIYGTEDKNSLNLTSKIFEVERTVKEKPETIIITSEQKTEEAEVVHDIQEYPIVLKKRKESIFIKILKYFKNKLRI